MTPAATNFDFLASGDPKLAEVGGQAEKNLAKDPNGTLTKLRLFVELLIKQVGLATGVPFFDEGGGGYKLMKELGHRGHLPASVAGRCHKIRKAGNRAAHEFYGDKAEAVALLRDAFHVALWFQQNFRDPSVKVKYTIPKSSDHDLTRLLEAREALEAQLAASEAARKTYEANLEIAAVTLARPAVYGWVNLVDSYKVHSDAVQDEIEIGIRAFRDTPEAFEIRAFGDVADDKFGYVELAGESQNVLVLVQAPEGDALVYVWVGGLDAAAAWVKDRRAEVHPTLGTLQIYREVEAEPSASAGLLAEHSDDDLVDSGVPGPLLPAVRAAGTADALTGLCAYLPPQVAQLLIALGNGSTLEAARAGAGVTPLPGPVEVGNLEAGLNTPSARQDFAELDDEVLRTILKEPLSAWRIFLHPSQDKLVRRAANGPMRVLGGAGTGKTVVLLHRAVHLVKNVLTDPSDKILITTFNRTLAKDLEGLLVPLVTQDELARFSVTNLNRWAAGALAAAGIEMRAASVKEAELRMESAARKMDPDGKFPVAFYRDEWDALVQARGVHDWKTYARTPRTGRGTPLSGSSRRGVWRVMAEYRRLLDADGLCEWPDQIRRTRELLEDSGPPFRAVLADEVQDFDAQGLRLLRALVPEAPCDIFLVGDGHQRIYGRPLSLGSCGIDIRGRGNRLRLNYRTTEAIRTLAVRAITGVSYDDMDGQADTLEGYVSLRRGAAPSYRRFESYKDEAQFVAETIAKWLEEGIAPGALCISARRTAAFKAHQKALDKAKIPWTVLGKGSPAPGAVRLATMHRMKGMEFKRVVLVGVQKGVVPLDLKHVHFADAVSAEVHNHRERSLFYVAATRARDELVVTGCGEASPLLD